MQTALAEGSRPPRTSILARGRFALTLVLIVAGFLLWLRAGLATPAGTIVNGVLPLALVMLSSLTHASVGLLLSLRRPEVRIGALEAWVGLLLSALAVAWGYLAIADSPAGGDWPGAEYVSVMTAVLITPLVPALAIGLGLLFPDDRLATPNWFSVVVLATIGAVCAGIGRLLRPGAVVFVGHYDNPLGVAALGPIPAILQVGGYACLGVAALLTGVCLIRRYQFGDAVTRAQLRIFTAITVTGAVAFALFVVPFLVPSVSDSLREAIVLLNLLVFTVEPLAIALAIARYRLFEVDQLLGRTFVYGALTAILAGVYAASLKVLESVFTWATGQSSDAALVITTLILVTTFTPIKTHLEHLVGRWWGTPVPGSAVPGAAAAGGPVPAAAGGSSLSPEMREEIRAIVRDELGRTSDDSA